MNGLIVDDEPLARAHLRRLLEAQGVEITGEAENAAQALRLAEDLHPDLIFLDIQMPGLTGMQAAAALLYLDRPPLLIFVTGYSEHAVAAFDNGALDYLVKPVAPDRLAKTLLRARARLADSIGRDRTRELITAEAMKSPPLRRLPVREDYAVRLVRVEEIICAVAREKRVFIHTGSSEYRTYYSLVQLESLLPGETFVRIHDACVVNIELIEEVILLGGHTYAVRLSNGTQLPVGRSRYAQLQKRLGLSGA